ncbi:hypothetical protein DIE16_21205 [Burkholderia sp. Bp9090]|nr:hypothetical protein DIE16_21205 [Burkholderia sp. Bp9090]
MAVHSAMAKRRHPLHRAVPREIMRSMEIPGTVSVLFCFAPNSRTPCHERPLHPPCICFRIVVGRYRHRERSRAPTRRRCAAAQRHQPYGQQSVRRRRAPRHDRLSGRRGRHDRRQGLVRQRAPQIRRDRFGSDRRSSKTAERCAAHKRSRPDHPHPAAEISVPLIGDDLLETTLLITEQPLSGQQDGIQGSAIRGARLARPGRQSGVCKYVRHSDQPGTRQERNDIARRPRHSEGAHRGRRIEAGQVRLANMLAEPAYFGKAEVFRRDDATTGIAARKGIVAFWNIPGYMNGRGGHIDLIDGARALCSSDCYWAASTVWFWSLR